MVANDQVSEDELQKKVLRMAAPAGIKTSIINLETAAQNILAGKYAGQRVMIIVKTPVDLVRLMDLGLPITDVNVGNMGNSEGKKQYCNSVFLTDKEREAFLELDKRHVRLTAQMTPEYKSIDFAAQLK